MREVSSNPQVTEPFVHMALAVVGFGGASRDQVWFCNAGRFTRS